MPATKQQTLVNAAIEMLHTRLVELEGKVQTLHTRLVELEGKVQTLRVETEKNLQDLHETARSHADLIDRIDRISEKAIDDRRP